MKKFITYTLCATLTIGLLSVNQASAESADDLDKKINELEKEKSQVQNKKGNLDGDKKKTEQKLDENSNKQENVENEMVVIDEELANTTSAITAKENEITSTNKEIENLKTEIEDLKSEIAVLKKRIKKREELLKERLRTIQQSGGSVKYMEVILGSKNFTDFISRSSAVNTIMDQDKLIMEELAADRKAMEEKKIAVETKKKDVESKKVAIEKQKEELETLQKKLDEQLAKKKKLKKKLVKEQDKLEEYKMSIEEEQKVLDDQEAIIKKAMQAASTQKQELERKAAEEAKKAQQNSTSSSGGSTASKSASSAPSQTQGQGTNKPTSGTGVLNWPVNGTVTSGYGGRSLGMHYGIDIVSGYGSPIYAAASGIVTRADRSSSYGNVVYVYHADLNLTTVYAHMSSISVSLGSTVNVGQQVGTMGNTGNVYPAPSASNPHAGTHLHFEVHNGPWRQHAGVNPMPYLN